MHLFLVRYSCQILLLDKKNKNKKNEYNETTPTQQQRTIQFVFVAVSVSICVCECKYMFAWNHVWIELIKQIRYDDDIANNLHQLKFVSMMMIIIIIFEHNFCLFQAITYSS